MTFAEEFAHMSAHVLVYCQRHLRFCLRQLVFVFPVLVRVRAKLLAWSLFLVVVLHACELVLSLHCWWRFLFGVLFVLVE